jgi:hypothetical protein
MEKEKVLAVIRSVNTKSGASLPASYVNKSTRKLHVIVSGTNQSKEVSVDSLGKYKEAIIRFDHQSAFEYKIVCLDTSVKEYNEQAQAEIAFWKKHPKVANIKNPNNTSRGDAEWDLKFYNENSLGAPEYLIEVFDEVEKEDTTRFSNQIKAIGRFYKMGFEAQKSVAYYFNINPTNLTQAALTMKMLGIDKAGVLFQNDSATNESNLDKFLITFTEEGKASVDVEMDILAKKAIDAGKISKKGELYFVGADVVASDWKGLILYLKDNESYRNILIRSISDAEEAKEEASTRGRKKKEVSEV